MEPDVARPMFDTDELVINMGPQHPATHGVLRVVLKLDGEKVVDADVVIGYLHRGVEKLSENRDWTQIVLLTDRLDYVASAAANLAYVETVEKLLSLEVPRRAKYIRTILAELQRLASHLVWLGSHAMDIGAVTVFLYCLRERELILDLFEEFCGARLTYNSMRIGGLPQDLPPGWDKKVLQFCDIQMEKLVEYETLLTHNRIWLERTKNIGVISAADAIAVGLCGPPLRGSGVARDVRKDEPYAAYAEMEFDVPVGTNGDTYDRYLVRLEEMRQSVRIIRQAIGGPARGAGDGQGAAAHQAAGGRDVSRQRVAQGRDRVLHRERRQVDQPVPDARAAAVVLQPPGAAAARARPPGGRRDCAHRHDRHRARGSGQVADSRQRSAAQRIGCCRRQLPAASSQGCA